MRFTLRQLLPTLFITLFVGVIVLYSYYQSRAILEGPTISIETPTAGMTATTSLMTVSGTVTHAKEITLDGRPIFIDLAGHFEEKLVLMDGYNIIELVAKDNEGRVERKTVELVYNASI
jgi:hypothetical protein